MVNFQRLLQYYRTQPTNMIVDILSDVFINFFRYAQRYVRRNEM